MKKILLALLFLSVIINGCITEQIDVSILDSKSCEMDDDCILTTIKKFECCASCFLESINKEAEFERVKWREQECGGSRKWEEDKWKSCFEYAECGIHRPSYVAACIDNKCEIRVRGK